MEKLHSQEYNASLAVECTYNVMNPWQKNVNLLHEAAYAIHCYYTSSLQIYIAQTVRKCELVSVMNIKNIYSCFQNNVVFVVLIASEQTSMQSYHFHLSKNSWWRSNNCTKSLTTNISLKSNRANNWMSYICFLTHWYLVSITYIQSFITVNWTPPNAWLLTQGRRKRV